jgi:hypothetical protein
VNTDDLIRRFVAEAEPVRRLPPPWLRAGFWLAVSLPCIGAVVFVMTPRPDLMEKLADPRFQAEQIAAFATAVLAAFAAFSAVVPGRTRRVLLLPLLPLVAWMTSLGQDCFRILLSAGPDGLRLEWDPACIPAIAIVGAVPAAAIAIMLRRGAPLQPGMTLALGGLAAAALGNFGLRLFHTQDASLMVLVWQLGTVLLLAALAGFMGRYILKWRQTAAA